MAVRFTYNQGQVAMMKIVRKFVEREIVLIRADSAQSEEYLRPEIKDKSEDTQIHECA